MKLVSMFLAAAVAREDAMGSQSGNLVVGDDMMGAGITDHADDMYNQLSAAPTPAPKDQEHKDGSDQGNTDQIDEQTDIAAVPTMKPTSFPTKDDCSTLGTCCTFGKFQKPVGWVGSGPGAEYCNIWKCASTKNGASSREFSTFKKQTRICSVEEHGQKFCSHTTCTFAKLNKKSARVISVHSDHREEVGGFHQCGFSKHTKASSTKRPACDCICSGVRRQDKKGFTRSLLHFYGNKRTFKGKRTVSDNHDATTDSNKFDAKYNTNNFYSQHDNIDADDKQSKFANENRNKNSKGDYTTKGDRFVKDDKAYTQYNENDQKYEGTRVAHVHIEN